MIVSATDAANSLLGRKLKDKWHVKEKITPKEGSTGGVFGVCYIVTDGEIDAFLKAINFQPFFHMGHGKPLVEILNDHTNAYKYELDLLMRCKNNRLSKVSTVLDQGEEFVEGYPIPTVPYLIFELADGDIRSHLSFKKDVEKSWKLKSLHDVAVGLKQLHSVKIGHQDLKPSNVLVFNEGIISKIGDLGRSLCEDIIAPHEEDGFFVGDRNYSPPEFLYGYYIPELNFRIRSTDMYLFGNLISFYFTGINMTALIMKNLDESFNWLNWKGTFFDVKDYLIDSFYKSIEEFKDSVEDADLSTELGKIIEYCCFPIPEERGHPKVLKNIGSVDGLKRHFINQYDLQRTISKFDLLYKKQLYKIVK